MTFNIPDCEHAENVTRTRRDMSNVVRNIDWDKDRACENGNEKEKPPEKTEEAEENNGIESNLVQEVGFF